VDNLRTATVGTRASTLTYGATTKRLDSVNTNGVNTAYDYDGNGNIWHKGSQTYAFDLGNRLTSANLGGSYAYDGHGRRTKIVRGDGSTQIQVYSQAGQLLWSETTASGSVPATIGYTCSTGTLVGTQCQTTNTYQGTPGLQCAAGDTLSGSTCMHSTTYSATASYSCPSGGTYNGSQCSRNDNYTVTTTTKCNTGDTLNGTICTHINYVAATVTYTCPSGYTYNGSACAKSTNVAATVTYSCNGGGTANASGICTGVGVLKYSYYDAYDACQTLADSYGLSLYDVVYVSGKNYQCQFQANTNYSCPGGGTLNGAMCATTSTVGATPKYSCTTGTLSGMQCAVPSTYNATVTTSCPNGGTKSGSTCIKTTLYSPTVTYNCPSGGTVSGSSCVQSNTYAATPTYLCTGTDTLNGSTCSHVTSVAATQGYSCPNGGTLTGTMCVGTTTTKTAYVYLEGKQIAEVVIGGVTQYVHTDALGSPVAHTNQAGTEINRTKFEPYGYTAAGTKPGTTVTGFPSTGSSIGFTGHVNDPDTDLVYMQQRYYDPVAGRFLSVDPVTTDAENGDSFNRYMYADNSPYRYIDPDGRGPAEIAERAKTYVGQAGWGKPGYHGGPGWISEFKCNLLVARVIQSVGDVPPIVKGRQATAGELANRNQNIENWEVVTDGSAEDGDILATGEAGDGYSGHTGIIAKKDDGKPYLISANSETGTVTWNNYGFRKGQKVTVRRYRPDEKKPTPKKPVEKPIEKRPGRE
jgi:RHS repeat-associated protein